jgi:hypothetical protein
MHHITLGPPCSGGRFPQLAAQDLILRNQRISNALRAMNTVRQDCRPVSLEELLSVTTEWVDAAMRLNERGLRTMERLIRAQQRRAESQLHQSQPVYAVQ